MFGSLSRRFRYGSYVKNEQGIKKFAERMMGKLTQKVTRESANYREMNETLLVEKANRRPRQRELEESERLESGEFYSVKRRLYANTAAMIVFVVAAIFMNALSLVAVFRGDASLSSSSLTWFGAIALSLVLAGGGLIVAERFIETLLPHRTTGHSHIQAPGTPMAVLWGALMVGILVAIYGFSGVQAQQLASAQDSGAFYFGYLLLALLLPILAGAARYDALRYIDVYKTTQELREMELRLAQIDSILRQNGEHESNFYKVHSISFWDKVNDFKTYKDNYNDENGMVESLQGHFARSYDAFQNEASKRYDADIRDATSRSMRHFDRPGSENTGRKLGQEGGSGGAFMMPSDAPDDERASMSEAGSESYLDPQPVR